jgi:hypothetical protein
MLMEDKNHGIFNAELILIEALLTPVNIRKKVLVTAADRGLRPPHMKILLIDAKAWERAGLSNRKALRHKKCG